MTVTLHRRRDQLRVSPAINVVVDGADCVLESITVKKLSRSWTLDTFSVLCCRECQTR
jgi:hypothetical protein